MTPATAAATSTSVGSPSTVGLAWGAPGWGPASLGVLAAGLILVAWGYARARGASRGVRLAGAILKGLAFAALAACLAEPMLVGTRPKPGANAFAVVADNSRSLGIRDGGSTKSRGDWVRDRLGPDLPWLARLGQDFAVRRHAFDATLRSVESFDPASLPFDGPASAIAGSLASLARRSRGLPTAGVLLFTDGNRTDPADLDVDPASLPPIYPVIPPTPADARDIGIARVSTSTTNFEAAPVVLRADVVAPGFAGRSIVAVVTDEAGSEVAREEAKAPAGGDPLGFRFQLRPTKAGVAFYKVAAFAADEGPKPDRATAEATLANNERLVVVDGGAGPYRVLYVSGRPNWEFKFLRRALEGDDQVELVGLIRIARRQAKFDFQARRERSTSPLFDGFDGVDAETADRADQPVLVRLGTRDEAELRDGFPKAADELFAYHAIIIDDLEAGFFTGDGLALLRSFVGVRGGGLLLLGGPDTFAAGKYDRTPLADLAPVYLRGPSLVATEGPSPDRRLALTREGWLQPWVRTRSTEAEEKDRLATMPGFKAVTGVGSIKPGASVLAEVADADGTTAPALVAQAFGRGRVAAMLIGDLWRWGLRRANPAESDLDRSWRQALRWLVADVPGRVEVVLKADPDPAAPAGSVAIAVRVRDAEYRPLENARVSLAIAGPGGEVPPPPEVEADPGEPGAYRARFVPRGTGAYKVTATAQSPDGSPIAARGAGWAAQPGAEEFARLLPDRAYLEDLARRTGGEVVDGDRLDAFVAGLAARSAPITESWSTPLWHQPGFFLAALALLIAEWGLRRAKGLA